MDEFEPVIIGFLCKWCASAAADLAGTSRLQYPANLRPIMVNCSGFIDTSYVLRALLEGADGVFIGACHPGDCHYVDGNLKARRRIAIIKNSLKALSLEPERIRFEFISASEGNKFARVVREFTEQIRKLGPNPLKRGKR
ncbi:MAG: methyl-viologen-reducing hydrogenase subunit delta [Thermoproteota archaeon]|mgnify:CR=1 FL=1|nr:MAG: methyl-viologen-reducing hydrogenase subunit delta [Candidatus Korarchaeota archaeon]RLG46026.1 MAG: methyl-viologen-reducing hydrogenase subunit delta [Candidatus Korarchaeota archaeon]